MIGMKQPSHGARGTPPTAVEKHTEGAETLEVL